MSRYIDVDEEIHKINEVILEKEHDENASELVTCYFKLFANALSKAPTADVKEVIRCKDCKYCDKEDEHEYWCTGRGFPCQLTTPDDYCSKGRKKEE